MRFAFGFLFVCAVGVMPLVGCNETAGEPCEPGTCPCQRPLDHYCEGSECPTWEEAVAAAKEAAWRTGCDCGLFSADFGAGQCGDLRYVVEDCHDMYIEYFDASGTLVAAYWWTDGCGLVCPGSCSVNYGTVPECKWELEQDFCEQLPELTCRDWCANEPQGSSCHQGPPESVPACREDCLQDYGREEESGCGDLWIRIKWCQVSSGCEASSGECDWHEERFARCQAGRYCEANCPTQDLGDCIEEYLSTGSCGTAQLD